MLVIPARHERRAPEYETAESATVCVACIDILPWLRILRSLLGRTVFQHCGTSEEDARSNLVPVQEEEQEQQSLSLSIRRSTYA